MVQKTVAHFDIPYLQFIDSNGKATEELPAFAQDLEHLKKIYIAMVKNRVFRIVLVKQETGLGIGPESEPDRTVTYSGHRLRIALAKAE